MSEQDLLSLLKYVPRYRELDLYIENGVSSVEKHMMEVMLFKGKGVVIEEMVEDNEVKEASDTGNRGKLLLLKWNESDVETKSEPSTSKVAPLIEGSNDSIFGFSNSDISEHRIMKS